MESNILHPLCKFPYNFPQHSIVIEIMDKLVFEMSTSLYLHSITAVLSLPIHSLTLLYGLQTNLQQCNDFIISLNCSQIFFLRVLNSPFLSLHESCSSFVRVALSCRLSLPSPFLITDVLSLSQITFL